VFKKDYPEFKPVKMYSPKLSSKQIVQFMHKRGWPEEQIPSAEITSKYAKMFLDSHLKTVV
jgi:hypothetical protein